LIDMVKFTIRCGFDPDEGRSLERLHAAASDGSGRRDVLLGDYSE
jgi:hypothetical protein